MEQFTRLTGVAAPLMRPNVDTDTITPIRRIISLPQERLHEFAFEPLRFREDGSDNPDFVLNKPRFQGAPIMIAGKNFGCGSSRETAVWAMHQLGIRSVIAASFGEIFFGNCFKNGMLPIVLPAETVDRLAAEAEAETNETRFTIDLRACTITTPTGEVIPFQVDPARREALLEGLDEIETTLKRADEIADFQARDRAARPWIYALGE